MYDPGRPRWLRGFFLCLLNILFLSHYVHSIEYSIEVYTQPGTYTDTKDSVSVTIVGTEGTPATFDLANPIGKSDNFFRAGSVNRYKVDINDIGIPCKVTLTLGGTDGWGIGNVFIQRSGTHVGQLFQFQTVIDDRQSTTRIVAVNGGWSQWTMWGNCSASCGQSGSQTRMRTCTDPSPGCGGRKCSGSAEDARDCFGQPCPTPTTSTTSTSTPATISTALKPNSSTGTDDRAISLGIVLGLAVILSIILTVFLAVVLRDKRAFKRFTKKTHLTTTYMSTKPWWCKPDPCRQYTVKQNIIACLGERRQK